MRTLQTSEIILIASLESVSLLAIGHLWLKRKKVALLAKCFWTIVLVVPALGLILYGFSVITQDPHGDDPPDTTGNWAPPGVDT
jgi:hypothetical protein